MRWAGFIGRSVLCAAMLLGVAGPIAAAAADIGSAAPDELAHDPETRGFAELAFVQARVLLADGAYARALALFERADAIAPSDRTARYFAGLCLLRTGRYDEAIASLETSLPPAASRIPEARIRYDLGEASFLKGDLDRSGRELRDSLRLDETDPWTHYYLGLTLLARRDEAGALSEMRRAALLDPSLQSAVSYVRALESLERGETEEGRRALERALGAGSAAAPPSPAEAAWLDAVSERAGARAPSALELRAGLSAERDDNPGKLSDEVDLPGGRPDNRAVLDVRAAYTPFQLGGWRLGGTVNGYASRHGRFREADRQGVQGLVQATYGSDAVGYLIGPLGYLRVPEGSGRFAAVAQVGTTYFERNVKPFRRDHDVAASLFVRERGLGKTQIDAVYTDRTYFDPDPDLFNRTGHVRMIRASQYFDLGDPRRYLRLALSHADHSARTPILAHATDRILAEVVVPFRARWTVYGFASHAREDYRAASALRFGEERRDARSEAGGSLVYVVSSHLYAVGRCRYTRSRVRPDELSYDRTIASAGLTYYW